MHTRLIAVALAIIIPPAANDASHRALGAHADFAAIVQIDRANALAGTGTLIAPQWILTAAHVVHGVSADSVTVRIDGQIHAVRRLVAHSSWQRKIAEPDLALIELATPIRDVAPIALAASTPPLGEEITLVGYGAGGASAHDRGVKRGATNRLDQRGGTHRTVTLAPWHLLIDFDDGTTPTVNTLGDAAPTALEGVNSAGDSGGPWLVQRAGVWRVAGVYHATSYNLGRAMGEAPRFGGAVAMAIDVVPFTDWIKETISASRAQEPTPRAVAVPTVVNEQLRGASGVIEREDGSTLVVLSDRGELAQSAKQLDAPRLLPLRGAWGRAFPLDGGRVAVSRLDRRDFLVFDASGAVADSITVPSKGNSFVLGAQASPSVIDASRRRYEVSGSPVDQYGTLQRIDGADQVSLTRVRRPPVSRVSIGRSDGPQATSGAAFAAVDLWTVTPDGRVAVVRGAEYRVIWFSSSGDSVMGPVIAYEPIPLTDAHKASYRASQRASLENARRSLGGTIGDVALSIPEPVWPAALPPLRNIPPVLGSDGTLWVPRNATSEEQIYDAFDARGERRARVAIPVGWSLIGAGRGTLYLIGAKGLGVVAEPR